MRILVDDEARGMIEQMCDVSLKVGGLQNLAAVTQVLKTMEPVDPDGDADELEAGTDA